ncbi:MAG: peptide deformylase [Bacilli bacterium]|nr:peptide deformylase [Bacilli bacterium]MBN2696085.1 peptide deformylase [Bacilli bacterium]
MLTMKDVIQEGHPTLRKRAKDVKIPLQAEDLETLRKMMEYIKNSQNDEMVAEYELRPAVGLSAPQINISKKLFCIYTPDETGENLYELAIVNPKIIAFSEEQTYIPGGEGCLSVDEEKNGLVPRAKRIKAKATVVDLNTDTTSEQLLKLSDYVGIVFQHEYDHLLGVLFVDKVKEQLPGVEPVVFNE